MYAIRVLSGDHVTGPPSYDRRMSFARRRSFDRAAVQKPRDRTILVATSLVEALRGCERHKTRIRGKPRVGHTCALVTQLT